MWHTGFVDVRKSIPCRTSFLNWVPTDFTHRPTQLKKAVANDTLLLPAASKMASGIARVLAVKEMKGMQKKYLWLDSFLLFIHCQDFAHRNWNGGELERPLPFPRGGQCCRRAPGTSQ